MNFRETIKILWIPALLAVLLTGCTDEGIVTAPEAAKGYPEATTPEILLENFVQAYTGRDLEGYADLLHKDFVFTFLPCDVQELGLKKDHYSREDELASAGRMFSGLPHVRENGRVVPAILEIIQERVQQLTAWESAGDPERPEIVQAVYHLRIRFVRGEAGDVVVDGPGIFFASPVADRRGADRYQLIGWIDKTRACAN